MSRVVLDKVAVNAVGFKAGRTAIAPVVQQTLRSSKRRARKSPAHLSGSGKPKPGLRLSEAIHAGPVKQGIWGVEQQVISPKSYSLSEHEGSRPHTIRPRVGKALKFKWRRRIVRASGARRIRPSQFSYFDHVRHPGNRTPVRFLTGPLAEVAKANNFFYRSNRAGI